MHSSIKLIDFPEGNCYVEDGAGEICVKGSIIFGGYYKDDKLTDRAKDKQGWLRTGDIALMLKVRCNF